MASSVTRAGAERLDVQADRARPCRWRRRPAPRARSARPGRNGVLRDPAHRVRGRAVDLGGSLPLKAPPPCGMPAVGVDDDLAAGETGVALRAARDERAGRVDVELHVGKVKPRRLEHRVDDLGAHRGAQRLLRDVGMVLGRQHDGLDRLRVSAVVAERDLGLAVGTQERQRAGAAHLGEALRHAVRHPRGHRHELRGLGRGVAEHDALVAGALLVVGVGRSRPRGARTPGRRRPRCRRTAPRSRR